MAGRRAIGRVGLVACVVVVLAAAATAAGGAGYVIDGAGRRALGFWAAVWGLGVGLSGLGSVAAIAGARGVRRVGAGVVCLTCAIPGWGLLWFAVSGGLAPWTLEGAWVYPLAVALLAIAVGALGIAVRAAAAAERTRR